jgi:hypothetical protein
VENFGLGCGSNVREPAQQVLGSEFNPQFCKKKKKKKFEKCMKSGKTFHIKE